MAELLTLNSLAALATLAALEIVLGVDNIVFIAILSEKVPPAWRGLARRLGLALAAAGRIVLLFAITWVITLEHTTVFTFGDDVNVSVKDVILIIGGLFLLAKATWEIHSSLEGAEHGHEHGASEPGAGQTAAKAGKEVTTALMVVLGQIFLLDVVFSIDSVLTAVGMVKPDDYTSAPFPGTTVPWVPLLIMVTAIVAAIAVMLIFIDPIARFIKAHPTMKMLALSFLLLIGLLLVVEGMGGHVPRGYVYFAMGFSLFVELLNLWLKRKRTAGQEEAASH
jgi:predicted tellurium resistance membrane protein TerC